MLALEKPEQRLAVWAEVLYLLNLLLLPGIAFIILFGLFVKHRRHTSAFVRSHLKQTVMFSIWAGILLLLVSLSMVMLGGFAQVYTWVMLILYFTVVHASFVLIGVLGLSQALAGKIFSWKLSSL